MGKKKKKKRNMEENEWEVCLVGRGNGEKIGETQLFSLCTTHRNFISPNWEKNEGGNKEQKLIGILDKITPPF